MKKHVLLALASALFWLAGAASAQLAGEAKSVVRDPEWQKRFLGSYGFLSGAEPEVNTGEIELLREVIELMKVDTRAASAMLGQAVGPDSSAALDFIQANLEFQNGELDAAKKHYDSALAKFSDFRRAHKNLGLLFVQSETFPEAAKHLARAVELGDRDGRNFGLLGYCHIQLGNHLAAEVAYRNAILQEPETRDWQLGLAQALLALEKWKDAADVFDAVIEANPEDAAAWTLQANAYIGLDQPLAAAVNLEAVRALGKAPLSSLTLLGDIYMNEGMYDLAKEAYLTAIEADRQGTNFRTAYRAAELLVRSRSFAEAGEVLASIDRRYENLSNDQELEVLTLEAKHARATGRDAEAARLLESIVERDGTRGDALLELAAYHHDQGDRERAVLMVERAQNLEAHEYQALLAHAQFEVAARDYARAAELLRKALAIRNEPRVGRFLARVEQAVRAR